MRDHPDQIDPLLDLARNQMESLANFHTVHLAIVSGRDETKVVEFEDASCELMLHVVIPSLIREIAALGAILCAPTRRRGKYGTVVTLIDRTLECYYAPIVRITNLESLIGDFRSTDVAQPARYQQIFDELSANWLKRAGR